MPCICCGVSDHGRSCPSQREGSRSRAWTRCFGSQDSKIDASDRKGFSVKDFASKHDLGEPVAVNWFTVAAPSANSEE